MHILLFLAGIAADPAAPSAAANPVCEVHVWDSKSYKSSSPAPAYGLIGALIQGTFPANTVQGHMEQELRPEGLRQMVEALPWANYLGQRPVRAIVEPEVIDKGKIKALRSSAARYSASTAPCYVELFIGDLTFEGSAIRSNLFTNFTVRTFDGGKPAAGNAIVWNRLGKFPAKDAASVAAASQSFRAAFSANLNKFLAKKWPRSR